MADDSKINKVTKTLAIIKAFVDIQPEWGVRELAKEMGFPASTLHRFLLMLQDEGIVEWSASTSKYRIGVEMIRISSVISANVDIVKISKIYMRQLSNCYKETICLVLYQSKLRKIVFVHQVNGPNPLQYVMNLGELQPVPFGASGLSIFAFLDPAEREAIFEQEALEKHKRQQISMDVETILKQGYASTQGHRTRGAKGIAAPIFNAENQPVGSLLFTVPIDRFDASMENLITRDVKKSAQQISTILGYSKKREARA